MAIKVVVTGASGLLGRAVLKRFKAKGYEGLAFTRAGEDLTKLDLHDFDAVEDFLAIYRPHAVVHCAAERRPDVAEKDPEGTKKLNVEVSSHLAMMSQRLDFKLIYISTDYIFDGNAPPEGYAVDAEPKPTNLYGETKLAGERAILTTGVAGQVASLRVPVLYGKAEYNSESAVNILVDGVQKAAKGEKVKMDDWATRYPTLVDDVAKVLEGLVALDKPLPPRLNFSSQKLYTKYTMATTLSRLLSLSSQADANLVRVSQGPGPGETVRPKDCHLSNAALESLGVDCSATDFEAWWKGELEPSAQSD